MKNYFRVTLPLNGLDFHHDTGTMTDVIDIIEQATGQELTDTEFDMLAEVTVAMIVNRRNADCRFQMQNGGMSVRVTYLGETPTALAG